MYYLAFVNETGWHIQCIHSCKYTYIYIYLSLSLRDGRSSLPHTCQVDTQINHQRTNGNKNSKLCFCISRGTFTYHEFISSRAAREKKKYLKNMQITFRFHTKQRQPVHRSGKNLQIRKQTNIQIDKETKRQIDKQANRQTAK